MYAEDVSLQKMYKSKQTNKTQQENHYINAESAFTCSS